MRCIKCGSERIVKFLDGFGKPRIYCKSCNTTGELVMIPREEIPLEKFTGRKI